MTIVRTMCFTSQPESMNSHASQSSSSGCDGGSPCEPRSSSVFDRPMPKNCFQSRFIVTRAVSGFSLGHDPTGQIEPREPLVLRLGIARQILAATPARPRSPLSSSQLPRGKIRTGFGAWVTDTRHFGKFFSKSEWTRLASASLIRSGASVGAALR